MMIEFIDAHDLTRARRVTMSDLKPCPFCGGKADYDWGSTTDIGGSLFQSGWACCTNSECNASIDIESVDGDISSADLIEKWNARTNDRLEQENAELREFIEKQIPFLNSVSAQKAQQLLNK